MKNSIFEMPTIVETLNINNLRTTSAKSINMHTIRKLIEYSFKNVTVKAMFSLTVSKILLFKGWSVLPPSRRGAGSERVNVYFLKINKIYFLLLHIFLGKFGAKPEDLQIN